MMTADCVSDCVESFTKLLYPADSTNLKLFLSSLIVQCWSDPQEHADSGHLHVIPKSMITQA